MITEEPWDCYHLESLLPLKETYRENTDFGFLLRHYWIPAAILQFRQSSRTTFPDGKVDWLESEIERKMARCRSNECLWREKVRSAAAPHGSVEVPGLRSEMLCSYDCYEQTFHSAKPILFAPLAPDQKTEARREALYRLPILCPPGPVPSGFAWYGKVDDDYMNFRLDAQERIGETSVLVIRRKGRYTVRLPEEISAGRRRQDGSVCRAAPTHHAFCVKLRRGVGGRLMDRVIDRDCCLASTVSTMTQMVARLIRSCPQNLAKPVLSLRRGEEPFL